MRYEVLNPLSFYGGRVERGEVIELTAEEAANYGADLVSQCVDESEPAVEPQVSEPEPVVEAPQEPAPQQEPESEPAPAEETPSEEAVSEEVSA